MNSPDEDPKPESELDYAPPWARENVARENAARESAARDPAAPDQTAPEQTARDLFRATLRHSGGLAVEGAAQNETESRSFGDDRPWHQRALDPELVPGPPAGASIVWPALARLFAVCTIAAMVAAAVVFLFSPRQATHKIAQATALAPAGAADDAPASDDSSRALAAGVPALAVDTSAGVTAPVQDRVAAATPQQLPEPQVTAPPSRPEAPAPQIASLPPPNAPAPAANEGGPADANPAATDPKPAASPPSTSSQGAPAQAAPAQGPALAAPQAAVVLDENEIDTLIRRGKNLLNEGDFSGARVLFERAANAGSAEAALALGSTYDPSVIKRLGAIMVRPDIASARKWYQLAADRGSAAASLQLANLPQGR
jgi:hypothetical protein